MCVVSMIGDHFNDQFKRDDWQKAYRIYTDGHASVSQVEELKREIQQMKALLIKALEYDKHTGQAHCEQEDKIATLRKVAESLGVNLDEVFK